MRGCRLTRRGWAALTLLAMMAGATLGSIITIGDSPCDWAVSTVECGR